MGLLNCWNGVVGTTLSLSSYDDWLVLVVHILFGMWPKIISRSGINFCTIVAVPVRIRIMLLLVRCLTRCLEKNERKIATLSLFLGPVVTIYRTIAGTGAYFGVGEGYRRGVG